MKKRAVVLGLGLGISLLLAGCGQQQVSHHENHHGDAPIHQQAQSKQQNQSKQVALSTGQKYQRSQSAQVVDPHNVHLTNQQLGTMVALRTNPNWFKQGVVGGGMYYSDQPYSNPGDELNGFSYVTTNGDGTSSIYYQLQGENVVIKYLDTTTNADCLADAPMKTISVRLSTLINDYYNTKKKQDEVNGYANRLLPESQYGKNVDNQSQSTGD